MFRCKFNISSAVKCVHKIYTICQIFVSSQFVNSQSLAILNSFHPSNSFYELTSAQTEKFRNSHFVKKIVRITNNRRSRSWGLSTTIQKDKNHCLPNSTFLSRLVKSRFHCAWWTWPRLLKSGKTSSRSKSTTRSDI